MNEYFIDRNSRASSGKSLVNFPFTDESLNRRAPSLKKKWRVTLPEAISIFGKNPGMRKLLERYQGEEIFGITHPVPTSTAEEKARLIDRDRSSVIKTLFFYNPETRKKYIFVVPALGRIDFKHFRDLMREELGFNPDKKLRPLPESELPSGMTNGTCNPFFQQGEFDDFVVYFDVRHLRQSGHSLADFSGVFDREDVDDRRMSMHLTYEQVFEYVQRSFPGRVKAIEIQYN